MRGLDVVLMRFISVGDNRGKVLGRAHCWGLIRFIASDRTRQLSPSVCQPSCGHKLTSRGWRRPRGDTHPGRPGPYDQQTASRPRHPVQPGGRRGGYVTRVGRRRRSGRLGDGLRRFAPPASTTPGSPPTNSPAGPKYSAHARQEQGSRGRDLEPHIRPRTVSQQRRVDAWPVPPYRRRQDRRERCGSSVGMERPP
jgi:hypothetical protein